MGADKETIIVLALMTTISKRTLVQVDNLTESLTIWSRLTLTDMKVSY